MDANTDNSLIFRLKQGLKNKRVSVPKFEEQTGIPKDRVYKWLKRGTGKVDHEDAAIVEGWLNGNMDRSTKQIEQEYGQPIIQVVLNLSYIGKKSADSIDKMADSNLLNAKSIATLVNLLANSDLASQLTSAQSGQHTQAHDDDNLPAEAFLGTAGSDAIRRQTQSGKKKITHR
jgi:hypothetical protein